MFCYNILEIDYRGFFEIQVKSIRTSENGVIIHYKSNNFNTYIIIYTYLI